jgi:hypothetical protein
VTISAARGRRVKTAALIGLAILLLASAVVLAPRSCRPSPDTGVRTETERQVFEAVAKYAGPKGIGMPVRLVEAGVSEQTGTARCAIRNGRGETRDLTFELARDPWSGAWYVKSHTEP